jgi:hypothetical protein
MIRAERCSAFRPVTTFAEVSIYGNAVSFIIFSATKQGDNLTDHIAFLVKFFTCTKATQGREKMCLPLLSLSDFSGGGYC